MEKEVANLIHDLAQDIFSTVVKKTVEKSLLAGVVLDKPSRFIYSLLLYDVLVTLAKNTEYICMDNNSNQIMVEFYRERLRDLTDPRVLERMRSEIKQMKESI